MRSFFEEIYLKFIGQKRIVRCVITAGESIFDSAVRSSESAFPQKARLGKADFQGQPAFSE
jgi:hypothetical protein